MDYLTGRCRKPWHRAVPWALPGLLFVSVAVAGTSPWALVQTATPGPPQVIGEVANGCIGGAERLPETGPGYISIRRDRNRFYGHPDTIRLIKDLGERVAQHTTNKVMIGDLSQPRGGLMSSFHRSHQNGMDVDIWFSLAPSVEEAAKMAPEGTDPPKMVDQDNRKPSQYWGEQQRFLIRTAAQQPEVDRIFVNYELKHALCLSEGESATWLAKVRPWWGHDAHFHVRLKCPVDSPDCKQQDPYPPGNGCGPELAHWLKLRPPLLVKKDEPKREPPVYILPKCRPVLAYGKAGHDGTEDRFAIRDWH
jgi:penicillin-insensitive murein DD-endopeptidase